MKNAETIIEQTAQELIEEYFRPGNTGFSKTCIKAKLREMATQIVDVIKNQREPIEKVYL